MSIWVRWLADVPVGSVGVLVLEDELLKPLYTGMSDADAAAAITAQTEPDDTPIIGLAVRRTAVEQRIWGKIGAFADRAFSATAEQQALTNACRNFRTIFSELEGYASLVRGNALWNAMDADLTLMTGSSGGGPVLTVEQADAMRALGDSLRQKWFNGVVEGDVYSVRNP